HAQMLRALVKIVNENFLGCRRTEGPPGNKAEPTRNLGEALIVDTKDIYQTFAGIQLGQDRRNGTNPWNTLQFFPMLRGHADIACAEDDWCIGRTEENIS